MRAITEENLEPLRCSLGVPDEPDVPKIGIDSVDFWLWKAHRDQAPHHRDRIQRDRWTGPASLDALVALGATKG
jgi:hypothetical protein